MRNFKLSFFIVLVCFSIENVAQNIATDSLLQIINTTKDVAKVSALIELSRISLSIPDTTIKYAKEAQELSGKLNLKKEEALAYKYIGLGYSSQNMYVEATLNWQLALQIFEEIKDKDGISNILSNLGTIYSNQGDDVKALELYLKALQIAEEIDDKIRTLTVSLNIGLIYQKKSATLDKALDYYFISLELAEALDYPEGIGYTAVNIGEVYFAKGDDSTALAYFNKSLDNLQDSNALPYPMINIGKVYSREGDFEKALEIQKEAFNIAKKYNSKLYMAQSLLGMASTYYNQNKLNDATAVLKQAESISLEIGSKESLKEAYEGLAKYSANLENYKDAYQFQKSLTAINDSLFKSANEKRLNLMMTTFNLEKKEREVEVQELTIQKQRIAKNAFLIGLLLIFTIAFITFKSYMNKVKTNRLLDVQKMEIEKLLMNILPAKVAKELREDGRASSRYFKNVSVLFTDFKDFSKISEGLSPNKLVAELNEFFNAFDQIIEKHHLEKIKTIGDSYMCVGGLPSINTTHPVNAVEAGLEMQEYMKVVNLKRVQSGFTPWELRVGIHSGPVTAGVVGSKKYAYDIWGSTVNVASRMESNGEVGKVNISSPTYKQVKEKYNCLYRGKISAKNIGEIDMYFIEGLK